ncbi:hypothetical protein LWI28_008156 [Acer negundo]|uniref:Uncharacterized protein n=1 Tax=Acer negundo TaxID=4023 RepID=A0AAD5ICU6_ACENE|nr:hypothetical protein LWI28_008156 [Acer negundo]
MSVEASGGGASVDSSDRSGGNNVSHECRIGIDQIKESSYQRSSEQEMMQFVSSEVVNKIGRLADEESSDQNEEFSEEENKWFVSLVKALEVVNKTGRPANAKPKIQKVPSMLRNNDKFKKHFEPKVFSFGPHYHQHPTLEMAKQIKDNLAADFLQQNGVKIEDLYRDIKKQINKLKECYDKDMYDGYGDHKLARMFLVDGCAILQFMYIFVDSRENPEMQFRNLGIKTDYAVFLAHDLLLLENQLPYHLLQLIIQRAKYIMPHTREDEFCSTSKKDKLLESIYKFFVYRFRTRFEWYKNEYEILKDRNDDHVHLLDLWRKKLIQPLQPIAKKRDLIEIIIGWTCFLFDKLNHFFLKCNRDRDRFPILVPFRNIGKLREAGINLKPSKTSCVSDISFSGGTLKLPPIVVLESTVRMFLNMLAYEMCPDFHNEFEVSTYMWFMDKLIDRTKDVEELREKNILRNELGSDEEVVKLFNEIGTHLRPNYEYYAVKSDIDNYFDNKGLIWIHKVTHDIHQYFKRRWSLLAFIAALLALASTIIQAVITFLAYQADSKKGN